MRAPVVTVSGTEVQVAAFLELVALDYDIVDEEREDDAGTVSVTFAAASRQEALDGLFGKAAPGRT